MSDRATIFTFTVNHQQFHPEVPPPYVIAIVELGGEGGERVIGNVVGADPDALHIGQPVEVDVERRDDQDVPVFRVVPE